MDATIQVAIIAGLFTVGAALLTSLASFYRERLEKRRIRHEENKWALDLNNQREMELHKMRLRTYPEVFAALRKLSSYTIHQLDEQQALELADRLHEWAYGEPGLCMLPDTRTALFVLRDKLVQFTRKKVSARELLRGPRTDLIELMRRDLNHDWSEWREFEPLIERNRARIQAMLDGDGS